MLISEFLGLSGRCVTDVDVLQVSERLVTPLQVALGSRVQFLNTEYTMERGVAINATPEPYFSVDLALEVSSRFVIQIKLELSKGQLLASESTYQMLDRLGVYSHDWLEHDGEEPSPLPLDFEIETNLAVRLRQDFMVAQLHLMVEAGVDRHIAQHLVEQFWETNSTPADIYDEAKANAKTQLQVVSPIHPSCCVAILPTGDWAGVESEDDVKVVWLTDWQMSALHGLTESMVLTLEPNMTEEDINELIFDMRMDNATTYAELGGVQ